MDLFGLLEAIIVMGILFGIVYAIVQWVPMPEPFKLICYGVLALICVVILFDVLRGGSLGTIGLLRPSR